MSEYTPEFLSKLWSRIDCTAGMFECWRWTGAHSSAGYGQVGLDYRVLYVHRVVYELQCGSIPDGLEILHSCDNPGCCNPAHLSVGSHKQNMVDMAVKRRSASGENHGHAKLSNEQVEAIRSLFRLGKTRRAIADELGVGYRSVVDIVSGRRWNT